MTSNACCNSPGACSQRNLVVSVFYTDAIAPWSLLIGALLPCVSIGVRNPII